MTNSTKVSPNKESKDTWFDALAAVALVSVFVAVCIIWIGSQ